MSTQLVDRENPVTFRLVDLLKALFGHRESILPFYGD
jgi:hypothetical protein